MAGQLCGLRNLWFVWFGREIGKREIDKREYEKRERDEKYSRFNVLFGIREWEEK
jgi:hypothetical protein